MTARRQARGGNLSVGVNVEGAPAPPELFDEAAPPWRSNRAYRSWLNKHGLESMLVHLRFDIDAHPANRRNYAAEAWAEAAGVLLDDRSPTPRADWHKLRAVGLLHDYPRRADT